MASEISISWFGIGMTTEFPKQVLTWKPKREGDGVDRGKGGEKARKERETLRTSYGTTGSDGNWEWKKS